MSRRRSAATARTPAWATYHQAMSDAVARLQQTITGLERRLAAMEARR